MIYIEGVELSRSEILIILLYILDVQYQYYFDVAPTGLIVGAASGDHMIYLKRPAQDVVRNDSY